MRAMIDCFTREGGFPGHVTGRCSYCRELGYQIDGTDFIDHKPICDAIHRLELLQAEVEEKS